LRCAEDERLLINWCVNAAEEMIRLLELLRTNNSLAYRSYTDVQGCVAAATLILLCGIIERKSSYEAIVDSAISSLSCIATNTDSFQSALDFIRSFQGITNAAHERCRKKPSRHSGSDSKHTISASYVTWLSSFDNEEQYVPPSPQATEIPLRTSFPPDLGGSHLWEESEPGIRDAPSQEPVLEEMMIESRIASMFGDSTEYGWNSIDSLSSATTHGLMSSLVNHGERP
jgi:hypothetical protein